MSPETISILAIAALVALALFFAWWRRAEIKQWAQRLTDQFKSWFEETSPSQTENQPFPATPPEIPLEDTDSDVPWRTRARNDLEKQKERLHKIVIDDEARTDQQKQGGELPRGILERTMDMEVERDKTYVLPSKWCYFSIVIAYLVLQVGVGLWSGIILLGTESSFIGPLLIDPGFALLLLQGAHLVISIRSIRLDELPGIDIFGRPLYEPKPGILVVPFGLLTLTRASRSYRDMRYPGPADKIWRISETLQSSREGGDIPPTLGQAGYQEGLVRPLIATTGEPRIGKKERKQNRTVKLNPLDQQQAIEYSTFVRYRPSEKHGGIFRLIRNLGIRGKGPEEIHRIVVEFLREQNERDANTVISRHTYATLRENLADVNTVFAYKLQASIMRLGIQLDLEGTSFVDMNPSRSTNQVQADARRAEFERDRAATIGKGEGEAARYKLEGLAAGYKKIKTDTGVSGEAVIASETAKNALSQNTDTLVLGTGGIEQLFGLVKAGQGMLKRQGGGQQRSAAQPKGSD